MMKWRIMKEKEIKLFIRMLSFLKSNKAPYLIGLIGLSTTNALSPILMAFALKYIMDFAIQCNNDNLLRSIIIVIAGMILLCIMFILFSYLFRTSTRKTIAYIKNNMFEKLHTYSSSYYDSIHSGDIISRFNNDIYLMEMAYSGHLRNIITSLMSGIYSIVAIFFLNPLASVSLLLYAVMTLIVNNKFATKLREVASEVQENNADITKQSLEIYNALPVIRMFNCFNFFMEKFIKSNVYAKKLNIKAGKYNGLFLLWNTVIYWVNFTSIIIFTFIFDGFDVLQIGKVIAILELFGGVSYMFNTFSQLMLQLQNSLAGSRRIFELMDTESESLSPNYIGNNKIILRFRDVYFKYDDNYIIEQLNISIQKPGIYAFVGPSGSGKTTIFKLILGLYAQTSGTIEVYQSEADDNLSLDDVRKQIAYVPQNAFMLNGTIKENIICNMPYNNEKFMKAVELAQVDSFANKLPEKYETLCGENGVKISGGQRQRIAIARAIYKDSPIILLDEATSALDSDNEVKIQDHIYKSLKGKTVIVIAHRLSTILNADRIYFVKDGQMLEEGTHSELISKKTLYSDFYKYQFANENK